MPVNFLKIVLIPLPFTKKKVIIIIIIIIFLPFFNFHRVFLNFFKSFF